MTDTVQLCRDCLHIERMDANALGPRRCPSCHGSRLIRHPELMDLSIAHIDCDAFYASVEKRDDPSLADKPVIVGGGQRGVVSAACYVARIYGVRSAMPMFKALKACPDAVVIRPNMEKYSAVGRQIRALMLDATPLVEPLSIDEAFLDLSGTTRLHGRPPAATLAHLVKRIETEIGVSASIGLSYNKSLAKIASDLDKPRGFAVLGRADALSFLEEQPVGIIWGVGKSLRAKLEQDGLRTIRDLKKIDKFDLIARYGAMGKRLYHFARGEDDRGVQPDGETKSISAETTFNADLSDIQSLKEELWPLCEKVARRMKRQGFAGRSVHLKLKTADFKTVTRSRTLPDPTQFAEVLYRTAAPILEKTVEGRAFRLIGVGVADLTDPVLADPIDLADPDSGKRAKVERAIDAVRAKLGDGALKKGRGWH
ncbi:DNA polymerase IV [Rhodospirillaceae bacterium KN72]|uniref:DNA polymerase IV n=1 Tax=Pacificispira spongiicola TaxID=2729598 RepID=A0A7Y0DZ42_9PROT|nr:DNA polymerase IV [Pacificispira spongiicola]NMM44249.1 DNA polymerase IV [Pacificispira spongiicola]